MYCITAVVAATAISARAFAAFTSAAVNFCLLLNFSGVTPG